MSREFQVEWVGENTRQWRGKHGEFVDYRVALAGYDAAKTVVLTQKPDTPAPEVGQSIYGGIVVDTPTGKDGETFEVHKLKKEQRPDGQGEQSSSGPKSNALRGPQKLNGQMHVGPPQSLSPSSPGPEFWAQKDRRISRAGILQAVVASGQFNSISGDRPEYVDAVNKLTDALLDGLNAMTPAPGDSQPEPKQQTLEDVAVATPQESTPDDWHYDDEPPF